MHTLAVIMAVTLADGTEVTTSRRRVVFFVPTDAEVGTMRDTDEFRGWTAEFVLITRSRDEFDLVRALPPRFELDSKERFERDFQSSTYYYLL